MVDGKNANVLRSVTVADVDRVYADHAEALHKKIDATRDAYLGFIFPVTKADLMSVADALGLDRDAARQVYKAGRAFSSFRTSNGASHLTNHIVGASLLVMRGKSLDNGLSSVTDQTLGGLIEEHEEAVLEIAEIRSTWFGRIYFPAIAFSNAIGVFGGKVSPETLYEEATKRHFSAVATDRKTIRGDFGIAAWLTMLGRAP